MSTHSVKGFFKLTQADKAALLTPGTRFVTTSSSADLEHPLEGKLRLFFTHQLESKGRFSAIAMDCPAGKVEVARFDRDFASDGKRVLAVYKGPGVSVGAAGPAIAAFCARALDEISRRDVTDEMVAIARKVTSFLVPRTNDPQIKVDAKLGADLERAGSMLNMPPAQVISQALASVLNELRKLEQEAVSEGIFAAPNASAGPLSLTQRQLRYASAILETYFCSQPGQVGEEAHQILGEVDNAMSLLVSGKPAGDLLPAVAAEVAELVGACFREPQPELKKTFGMGR